MLDKKKIKEKLEKERDALLEQMKDMGRLNKETGEASPKGKHIPEVVKHAKWILSTYHKHEAFKKLVDGRRRLTI